MATDAPDDRNPPSQSRDAAASSAANSQSPRDAAGDVASATLGVQLPLTVLSNDTLVTLMGSVIGRGRAECRDSTGLLCWVSVDIAHVDGERYALYEHVASEEHNGMYAADATSVLFESVAALRAHCLASLSDPLRDAARCAALDDAARRWPALRQTSTRRAATVKLPSWLE